MGFTAILQIDICVYIYYSNTGNGYSIDVLYFQTQDHFLEYTCMLLIERCWNTHAQDLDTVDR